MAKTIEIGATAERNLAEMAKFYKVCEDEVVERLIFRHYESVLEETKNTPPKTKIPTPPLATD